MSKPASVQPSTPTTSWILYHRLDCRSPARVHRRLALASPSRFRLESSTADTPARAAVDTVLLPGVAAGLRCSVEREADGWWAWSEDAPIHVNGRTGGRLPIQDSDLLGWCDHLFTLHRPGTPLDDQDAANFEVDGQSGWPQLSTGNDQFARQLRQLTRVARSLVPVLITGETGTGKEVVARAVHHQSGRTGPFVAVNCGALAETLVHSQLFGHRKGAFSGATEAQVGFIRESHGGTLFLDEVGELPVGVQAVLLRVLQEREVLPVGACQPVPVDLRVVAATNRNLEDEVDAGQFRSDLYARLLGFAIELPPLRERPEDLSAILAAVLRRCSARPDEVQLTLRAAVALLRYPWPLNVRELERCLSTAVVLAGSSPIDLEHLPRAVRLHVTGNPTSQPAESMGGAFAHRRRPALVEEQRRREALLELLEHHRGNISAVAKASGKARAQIHRWMRRYQIDHQVFRGSR